MTIRPRLSVLILPAIALLLLSACGSVDSLAGNSANTGNYQASGTVLTPAGKPAPGAWVLCRPDTVLPWEALPSAWVSRSDSIGRYRCLDLPAGRTGITALDPGTGLGRWHGLDPARDSTPRFDSLASSGGLRVALPPGCYGTLFLSGTDLALPVAGDSVAEFPHVPAGWCGAVRLLSGSAAQPLLLDSGAVRSSGVDSVGFTRNSTRLRVALAGGLTSAVTSFPLLVRLDSSWKGFAASLPNGADLRLSLPGGKALPLTVVAWDRVAKNGTLWTRLDTLAAPGDSVDLTLSWGIPVPTQRSASAFASSAGWAAAWPLGDSGTSATDLLGAFAGTAYKTSVVTGPIAKATHFDGHTQIVVERSDTGALALPVGGSYTLSCWARLARTGGFQYVMGHGFRGAGLFYQKAIQGDTDVWVGTDYRLPATAPYVYAHADTTVWTHLALSVADTVVTLYVNGSSVGTKSAIGLGNAPRFALPFVIGTSIDSSGLTSTNSHFYGDISDAWVQSTARSGDWIRLVAANESPTAVKARILP